MHIKLGLMWHKWSVLNWTLVMLQAGKQTDLLTSKKSSMIIRLGHFNTMIFPGNNYSISSSLEATRVNDAHNMCGAAMLCCSCTTDPSCWYSTCHFLSVGEYGSNTLGISMKGRRHTETSSPPHSVHIHTLDRTHIYSALANPAHFWQLNSVHV